MKKIIKCLVVQDFAIIQIKPVKGLADADQRFFFDREFTSLREKPMVLFNLFNKLSGRSLKVDLKFIVTAKCF